MRTPHSRQCTWVAVCSIRLPRLSLRTQVRLLGLLFVPKYDWLMPNIATALKSEITRLARKEQKQNTDALKKALASYRAEIAALKRRVSDLERGQKRVVKVVAKSKPEARANEAQGSNLRFRATGFAQHRKRLGLSAAEMGLLLDASGQSVYKWETGAAKPRAKHLHAIAGIRKIGKREAAKRLQALAGAAPGKAGS